MCSAIDAAGFATVCQAFRAGNATVDVLRAALDRLTVFAARPEQPGVLVTDIPGHGQWLPVFTSLCTLKEFVAVGESVEMGLGWLSTSGADLIEHLPSAVGVLVDPTREHAVALPPLWLRSS